MLESLKQWYCDKCGQLIEKPEDGYVQFKRSDDGIYEEFVIVHHYLKSPLNNKGRSGCYIYDSDLDLPKFLGDNGKVRLLSMVDKGPYHMPDFIVNTSNIREWNELFKRLQLPYYEEARQYWNNAIHDGYFSGTNEIAIYLPERLKNMIEHYGVEEM